MPRVTIDVAASVLRGGGIAAFPTETVYGLGADAMNPEAIARVFAAKGRPTTHPLILHARDPEAYAYFDARARALARFWPGPLTLVLPRRPHVPDALTGGRDSVAVRMPAHPVALALIDAVGHPLAAPSANRFGGISPTTADHVLAAFPDVPVLDGGPCAVGVESTIVDLTGPIAAILRPGAISAADLDVPLGIAQDTAAPGTLPVHYAPTTELIVADDADELAASLPGRVGIIRASAPHDYARRLYAELRALDGACDVIVAEWAPDHGIGLAVNDRLRRASARYA